MSSAFSTKSARCGGVALGAMIKDTMHSPLAKRKV